MPSMLDLFVPREKRFFKMLGDLSEKTHLGSELFLKFISHYPGMSHAKRTAMVGQLKDIEHDCDGLTHMIAVELNKTFLTPIDREDIHKLSTLIDDVMDIIYNVSHKFVLYNITKLPKYLPELATAAHGCAEEIALMIPKLGTNEKVGLHLKRIHELEKEADSLRNEAFAYIFNGKLKASDIIKLKDLYEWLEGITDKSEDVADVVEGIVIKYA